MSPEDKKLFEDFFDMFSTPGWARLIENTQQLQSQLESVRNITDEKTFWMNKGRVAELDNIINLKAYMEMIYEQENDEAA